MAPRAAQARRDRPATSTTPWSSSWSAERCASITGRCSGRIGPAVVRRCWGRAARASAGLRGTSGTSVGHRRQRRPSLSIVVGVRDRGRRVEVVVVLASCGRCRRRRRARALSMLGRPRAVTLGGARVDDAESSSPLHATSSARLSPHASRSRAGRTKDRAVTMSWVLPVPPTGPARASCPPPERAQGGSRLGAGDARTDRTPNRGASTRAPRRMRYWG